MKTSLVYPLFATLDFVRIILGHFICCSYGKKMFLDPYFNLIAESECESAEREHNGHYITCAIKYACIDSPIANIFLTIINLPSFSSTKYIIFPSVFVNQQRVDSLTTWSGLRDKTLSNNPRNVVLWQIILFQLWKR